MNDVKDAPKELTGLASEASALLALMTNVKYSVQNPHETEQLLAKLKNLDGQGQPLGQFQEALVVLANKLEPSTGLQGIAKRLGWPHDRKHIEKCLGKIERLKSLILLAYQQDHL